jgi:hypothetical protein
MAQIPLHDSLRVNPRVVASQMKVGDTSTIGDYVFTTTYLDTEKAVQVVDGSIEIEEKLLQPGLIYEVELNGEKFYVRKYKSGAEIFQLSEEQ